MLQSSSSSSSSSSAADLTGFAGCGSATWRRIIVCTRMYETHSVQWPSCASTRYIKEDILRRRLRPAATGCCLLPAAMYPAFPRNSLHGRSRSEPDLTPCNMQPCSVRRAASSALRSSPLTLQPRSAVGGWHFGRWQVAGAKGQSWHRHRQKPVRQKTDMSESLLAVATRRICSRLLSRRAGPLACART